MDKILIFILLSALLSIQPAKPAPPTITPCFVVSTFGDIEIARCEDYDSGFVFYQNSLGFMFPSE